MSFILPAEFEPVSGVWLSWPHNAEDWPGRLDAVRDVTVRLVRHIHRQAPVHLLTHDEDTLADAMGRLSAADVDSTRIHYLHVPSDRGWMRDIAPAVVRDGSEPRDDPPPDAVCWTFNGWARYDDHTLDAQVAARLCEIHGFDPVPATFQGRPVVLEGGAYDVNGLGAVLLTRECLLDQGAQCRNPGLGAEHYELLFDRYLGAPHAIWLSRGVAGDDTHGHVDDVARFVGPETIVCAVEDDPDDVNHAALRENLEILQAARRPDGGAYEVIEVPLPGAMHLDGDRLPASYMNFLICNEIVLVPTFGHLHDDMALHVIGAASGRRPVGIDSRNLILGLGSVHCLTHQMSP